MVNEGPSFTHRGVVATDGTRSGRWYAKEASRFTAVKFVIEEAGGEGIYSIWKGSGTIPETTITIDGELLHSASPVLNVDPGDYLYIVVDQAGNERNVTIQLF